MAVESFRTHDGHVLRVTNDLGVPVWDTVLKPDAATRREGITVKKLHVKYFNGARKKTNGR